MQIIQVLPKRTGSLREKIIKDTRRLEDFGLVVTKEKTMDRIKGWSEVKSGKGPGVLKIEWHAPSQTLICRAETKNDPPHIICGAFISFLLAHYSSQIASMHTYTYPSLKRKKITK
jgi:hypothetical protein